MAVKERWFTRARGGEEDSCGAVPSRAAVTPRRARSARGDKPVLAAARANRQPHRPSPLPTCHAAGLVANASSVAGWYTRSRGVHSVVRHAGVSSLVR